MTDGRHPVVERYAAGAFVPNDIDLNGTTRQLVILTGPNMGGKSTYLRQAALIPLLAQIGSFVPARHAKVPIVDRIFARVGASDNIARGQSTFMVEMQETANILHTASSRSLVVLDEIGRGTSTFDGLSIAWAVAEHLASNGKRAQDAVRDPLSRADGSGRCAAGRHQRSRRCARMEGRHRLPAEDRQRPIGSQLRNSGGAARRACRLPVVARAKEILAGLERDELSRGGRPTLSGAAGDPRTSQFGLFAAAGRRRRRRAATRDPVIRGSRTWTLTM